MAADDKWEDESLIVVELSGIIEQDWIQNIGNRCKIVGLDTDEPLLQIDRYVFSGQHKDTDGTDVIFEHSPGGDGDAGQHQLRYKCHTFKKLCMQRAFLTPKEEEPNSAATGAPVEDPTAVQTQPVTDSVEDESRDVNPMDTTSCVDTDDIPTMQRMTETMMPGGAAEKDTDLLRTCGENVTMGES